MRTAGRRFRFPRACRSDAPGGRRSPRDRSKSVSDYRHNNGTLRSLVPHRRNIRLGGHDTGSRTSLATRRDGRAPPPAPVHPPALACVAVPSRDHGLGLGSGSAAASDSARPFGTQGDLAAAGQWVDGKRTVVAGHAVAVVDAAAGFECVAAVAVDEGRCPPQGPLDWPPLARPPRAIDVDSGGESVAGTDAAPAGS